MPEDTHEPTPRQPRRGDLIIPPDDTRDNASPRKKRARLPSIKPVGFIAKLCILLIIISTFTAMFQSDVLWTKYDSVERSPSQSMDSWTEAWSIQNIRAHDPLSTSSYFWEQTIPLPTTTTHRGINLLLHIIAAFLLLKCLEALKAPAAFAATLVFATHPTVLQPLFWPGYRTEFIGLVLILIALLTGIRNRGIAGYSIVLFFSTFASIIHPAAMAIPVIMIFIIIAQNKTLHFHTFNRVLPLICIALFVGAWTQNSLGTTGTIETAEAGKTLNTYGENMFFYLKQSLFPLDVALFHPAGSTEGFKIGAGFSLLPFLLFIPFYILAAVNFRKTWARAGLLGISAFLLLSLAGASETGKFIDGGNAHENRGLYIALPAIVALLSCGIGEVMRHFGAAGKILWIMGFSLFMLIQLSITSTFAYTVGQPAQMWQAMLEQWQDSWVPKAAFIETIQATDSDLITETEKIDMLIAILSVKPKFIEERKLLARAYREAGQNNNAVREYKRILREAKPNNEFLEEAARLYDKVGLSWDARNARERIKN
ncbi:MAG: tetratricopeptide repeat protein [Lentimonas sp.]